MFILNSGGNFIINVCIIYIDFALHLNNVYRLKCESAFEIRILKFRLTKEIEERIRQN